MNRLLARMALAAIGATATPSALQQPSPEPCRPATAMDPTVLLHRAVRVMGMRDGVVLHFHSMENTTQDYQSDRSYPPFFSARTETETWFNPSTAVERTATRSIYPSYGPTPPSTRLGSAHATYVQRDTVLVPVAGYQPFTVRALSLNPWWVVGQWQKADGVRLAEECYYRDYWRQVLARPTPDGEQRLYLDPMSGFPVKLDQVEPHYLWGQVHTEYLYTTWQEVEHGGTFPTASFRLVDGRVNLDRTVGAMERLASADAPVAQIPAGAPDMGSSGAHGVIPSEEPDTVRVAPNVFLLKNRLYTETVAQLGDTVYVLDATLGEKRARQDSSWIARLFPGEHPVTLVVTDLAWPHIAGIRTWVGRGATVISHRASREFLQQVVDRRWTRTPDLLERRRATARWNFVPVSDSLSLAGGRIRLYAIDGIGSEGALMAYFPRLGYLWASDYVQQLRTPSSYTREVWQAARRVGIRPRQVAAMHTPLSPWSKVDALMAGADPAGTSLPPDTAPPDSLASQGLPAVIPGNSSVQGTRFQTGRSSKPIMLEANGQTQHFGELTQNLAEVDRNGRAALLSVQRFRAGSGETIDSSWADLHTLAPLAHRSHNPSRVMALDFAGNRVTGRYSPTDSAARTIDQHLATPAFDSNIMDLVIAALPLQPGYAVRIPYYIYERGGAVWFNVRVVDTTTVTGRAGDHPAWVVEATTEGDGTTRYWIDRATRVVLRSVHQLSDGRVVSIGN